MRDFRDEDFPVTAIGAAVYRKTATEPICWCSDMLMANEIALRLNRDNQVYPESEKRSA